MNTLSDQTLFHIGIIVSVASLVLLIVFLLVMRIKSINLKMQLNAEYGERIGNKKANRKNKSQ